MERSRAGLLAFVVDATLAAVLTVVVLLELFGAGRPVGPLEPMLAVLQTAPLAWRRRAPFAVYLVIGSAISAHSAFRYPDSLGPVATLVALYGVAALGSRAQALAALALQTVGVAWFFAARGAPLTVGNLAEPVVLSALAWTAGQYVKTRRLYAAELEARADALERTREREALQAVTEERSRIARELHDVVGHAVTLMVVQAGAGRRLVADDPVRAGSVFGAIEDAGRQALGELDRLLGVLRWEGEQAALAPQAGLDLLPALAAGFTAAGLPVEVRVQGAARPVPRALEVSAYRIVQEALTNSLRHAGPATATVTVRYRETCLELEVADSGKGPPAAGVRRGRGLAGIGERVTLFGGTLETGARRGGGFVMRCSIPLEAP